MRRDAGNVVIEMHPSCETFNTYTKGNDSLSDIQGY